MSQHLQKALDELKRKLFALSALAAAEKKIASLDADLKSLKQAHGNKLAALEKKSKS